MPELPEVETVVQGLKSSLLKRQISSVTIRSPSLRIPIPKSKLKALAGVTIKDVVRRAKYILIRFDSGDTLVSHLGMTGSFTVHPIGQLKASQLDRHDHILFKTDKGVDIVYRDPRRFGVMDVIKTNDENVYPSLEKLGVEPLSDNFNAAYLEEKLSHRTTPIKVAIMDQTIVVGVGNIYASEALYLAKIDPQCPSKNLSKKNLSALIQSIKFILNAAIESGGSTLRDYRRVGGEIGAFQFHFSVYDKEGEPCPDCHCSLKKTGGIQRIIQAGRSTFFCPTRQSAQDNKKGD